MDRERQNGGQEKSSLPGELMVCGASCVGEKGACRKGMEWVVGARRARVLGSRLQDRRLSGEQTVLSGTEWN